MILSPEEKQKRKDIRNKEKYNKEHKIINGINCKICSMHNKCFPEENSWFPSNLDYFYKNVSNSVDGLSNRCKKCEKVRAMQWKKDNPEQLKISNKKQNDKPEHKALHREVERKRREEGKAREWTQRNKDKVKLSNKKRKEKNHDINKTEWIACKEYFKDKDGDYCCAYCGLKIQNHFRKYRDKIQKIDLHKEHVIFNGADDLSNCIPSCQSCNSEKHESSLDEWYNKDNIKFSKKRYDKIQKWLNEDYKKYIILNKKPKGKYTKNPNNPKWKAS